MELLEIYEICAKRIKILGTIYILQLSENSVEFIVHFS